MIQNPEGLLGLSQNLTKLTQNRKKYEMDGLAGGTSANGVRAEVRKMELTKTAFITRNDQNVTTIHALKKVLAKSIIFYPHL